MKLPPIDELGDPTNTRAEQKTRFEQVRGVVAQLPGGQPEVTYTLSAAGEVQPVVTPFAVDTYAGAAADNLDRILVSDLATGYGYPAGSLLFLRALAASRIVTARHLQGGVGQLSLAGGQSFALSDTKWLVLHRRGDIWYEVRRAFGGDAAAERTYLGLTKAATAPNPANPGDNGKSLIASAGELVWGSPVASGGPAHRLLVSRTSDYTVGLANGTTYSQVQFNETTTESSAGDLWDPGTHEIKVPPGISFIQVQTTLELGFTSAPGLDWWVRAFSFFKVSGGGYPATPAAHTKTGLLSTSLVGNATASVTGAINGGSGQIVVASGDRLKLMLLASASGAGNQVKVLGTSLPGFCWLSVEFYL